MLPTGTEIQIKKMYGEDRLSAAQISESLRLELETVELTLAKSARQLDAKDGALRERIAKYQDLAVETMAQVMEYGESEGVRLQAAQYVLEVGLGQKELKGVVTPNGITPVQINIFLQQAKARHQAGKEAMLELASCAS